AAARVQARDDLIPTLAGKDVELVAHQSRRRIAEAHGRLPLLRQLLGPRRGGSESRHFVVPVGPAPLGPIVAKDAGGEGKRQKAKGKGQKGKRPLHLCISSSSGDG